LRVLVACEFSGVVRDAFAARGHEAWSSDLLPSETPGQHYQGDVRDILNDHWDLLIAHPPCTHLAVSGARWFKEKQSEQIDAILFFMQFAISNAERYCIENPISIMSSRWRKPDQIIQPYMFGEDASKKTCLWLKGLPNLQATGFVEPRLVCCGEIVPNNDKYGCPYCCGNKIAKPRWSNQCNSGQNKISPSQNRAANRSKTYPGIANAMAEQWG